ncbi:hypothetical protein GCM10022231_35710 [Gordonia caeni]|uniref:NADH-quinone oxidoreductase subunit NuoE n=1 Tax=Gordonia caeni TaxID=1007097 RepID=A0ABP7PTR1_9ACTN
MNEPVFLELTVDGGAPPAPFSTGQAHPPVEFGGPADYPSDDYDALAADAAPIIARYPQAGSALLPLLHLVQARDGYLTRAGIGFCARQLELTAAQVASVATFYSMYRREPTGEHLVGVCTTTLCAVMGGDAILAELTDRLGIAPGQTTDDGAVTLTAVECNAACDFAPVVMVNWEFFDDQTPESARRLVDDLRAGTPVRPSRGAATLCSFRQVSRLLAGAPESEDGDRP